MSVSDSNNNNNNKENENQGNSEIKMEEDNDDDINYEELAEIETVISTRKFHKKYSDLQRQWLKGFVDKKDIPISAHEKYGDHAYLLEFIDKNINPLDRDIAFHPNYSYEYTDYDKNFVLPSMSINKLNETEKRFKQYIDRLEYDILCKLKNKEIEQTKEDYMEKQRIIQEKRRLNEWKVPEYSIPIRTDIRKFNFNELALEQKKLSGRLFDVIMMDPPWQLATANPTRGVAIGYSQLDDNIITNIPVKLLQDNGLLFIWVINAKYRLALTLFNKWGYKMIGDIAWVKQTVNRRIANGHGFYLQHAKETCLIGLKGNLEDIPTLNNKKIKGISSDVIYSERRGQSQKPEEIYQYIEHLVPNGFYMEIFGRRNNLRNGWLTIGNEL